MSIDVHKEWLGIPESVPRPPDHYQLLRLPQFEDDTDKIRSNYRKLNAHVRKYATGKYVTESQELMNDLAKAMLCLTDAARKREYDESLGREFEPEVDEFGRQSVLDILVGQGKISRDQKSEVEDFANVRGLTERDAVVQMKLVKPADAAKALALKLGLSYAELEDMLPEDSVLDGVPRHLVKKHTFLPLFIDDDKLIIACIDEPEHELEEELRLRYSVPVRPVIVTPRSVNQAIAQYYAPGMRDEAVAQQTQAKAAGGKKKKGKKEKSAAPEKTMAQLSDGEKQERKQLGVLAICWSLILPLLPLLLSVTIAPGLKVALTGPLGYVPWLAIITLPATAWWVKTVYWK